MVTATDSFQRARSPEQQNRRRAVILDAAAQLLQEAPFAEIRLHEVAARAGLATSAVVRYFGTREALFLTLLEKEWARWLETLPELLPDAGDRQTATDDTARAIAASLCARPVLCELFSVLAGVLERNISIERARDFKRTGLAHSDRFAALIRERLPRLTEGGASLLASFVITTVAGLWPFASPSANVCAAISSDPQLHCAQVDFGEQLRNNLTVFMRGLAAEG